jgi:hypothetical protein
MTREFLMMPAFDSQWSKMGLDDDYLQTIQLELLLNPEVGDIIVGTGGLRKARFAYNGKGKRGGARIIYIDFVIAEKIILVYAYPKNERSSLSASEKKDLKKMIDILKENMGKG